MYSPVSSDRPRWHVPNRLVCSVSLLSLLLRRFSCSDVLPACRIGEGIKLDLKEWVWLGRKLCAQKLRNHSFCPTFSLHFPWQQKNGITDFVLKKLVFYMTESQVSSRKSPPSTWQNHRFHRALTATKSQLLSLHSSIRNHSFGSCILHNEIISFDNMEYPKSLELL